MSSLFGGTVVTAPTPLPPPTMPDPNSPTNIAAGQQQAAVNAGRAGRASTMLTTPAAQPTIAGGSLGGKAGGNAPAAAAGPASYSSSTL